MYKYASACSACEMCVNPLIDVNIYINICIYM